MPKLTELLSEVASLIGSNNWDIPKPGREFDPKRRYFGPDHPVQEEIKALGRRMKISDSPWERLVGYGLEAKGHYYSSLESAVINGRKHPDFEEYFSHWFYSDPAYADPGTRKQLRSLLCAPVHLKIEKGKTAFRYRSQKVSA